MLSKLLKYDFKSASKLGIPMVIALAVSIVLGFGGGYLFAYWYNAVKTMPLSTFSSWEAGFIWGIVLLVVVAVTAVVGIQVVIVVDYYKSLVTDEGYLTFTLPVSSKQILASKLINSCVWNLIIYVLCFSVLFAVIFGMGIGEIRYGEIFWLVADDTPLPTYSAYEHVNIILIYIIAPIAFVNEQLLVFMGIFLGAIIAKKHKVWASVGCILGINFVYGIIKSVATEVLMLVFIPNLSSMNEVVESANKISCVILIAGIIGLTAFNFLFFYITSYLMEKKLNLA